MTSRQWIEGTGAEISAYTSKHATERFGLVALETVKSGREFDQAKWD